MKLAPRLGLKWLIVFVLGAAVGMVAMRIIAWETSDAARLARVASRRLALFPPGFFDVAPLATKDESGPAPVKVGQILVVEVLEALPGRPITGEHIVRPDGTISLGFYGDVQVAGLNRNQIKVKILEHLQKYINDEVLGLVVERADGPIETIRPVDSNRIFVDDHVDYEPASAKAGRKATEDLNARIDELNSKLDRVLKELEDLRKERRPANAPDPAPSPSLSPR